MADVHHLISLGVGSPADIPHFILVGLSPSEAESEVLTPTYKAMAFALADSRVAHPRPEDRTVAVFRDDRTAFVLEDDRTFDIFKDDRGADVEDA